MVGFFFFFRVLFLLVVRRSRSTVRQCALSCTVLVCKWNDWFYDCCSRMCDVTCFFYEYSHEALNQLWLRPFATYVHQGAHARDARCKCIGLVLIWRLVRAFDTNSFQSSNANGAMWWVAVCCDEFLRSYESCSRRWLSTTRIVHCVGKLVYAPAHSFRNAKCTFYPKKILTADEYTFHFYHLSLLVFALLLRDSAGIENFICWSGFRFVVPGANRLRWMNNK